MQLEIPWLDADMLQQELETRTGLRLDLIMTDNTSTVMSLKPRAESGRVQLRLHHMFLSADVKTLHALADWVKRPKAHKSGDLLNAFIRRHTHLMRSRSPRNITLSSSGALFDLQAMFDELNTEYFDNSVKAGITWGRMPAARRRRSIRFGSYHAEENLIRIHPLLDQDFVPEYFVRYIVYHEMLHAHLGVAEGPNGRRAIHTAKYREMEQAYPDYARAEAWQRKTANLRKLLR